MVITDISVTIADKLAQMGFLKSAGNFFNSNILIFTLKYERYVTNLHNFNLTVTSNQSSNFLFLFLIKLQHQQRTNEQIIKEINSLKQNLNWKLFTKFDFYEMHDLCQTFFVQTFQSKLCDATCPTKKYIYIYTRRERKFLQLIVGLQRLNGKFNLLDNI